MIWFLWIYLGFQLNYDMSTYPWYWAVGFILFAIKWTIALHAAVKNHTVKVKNHTVKQLMKQAGKQLGG